MSIIDSLITDRTRADVERVKYLAAKGWEVMTDQERAERLAPMKGAYNAEDLNRVGAAVEYIAGRLSGYGYTVMVSPKTDWVVGDGPEMAQLEAYLADLRTIREALALPEDTPAVPAQIWASRPGAADGLSVEKANDIEQILVDIEHLATNMVAAYRHSGAVICGMEGLIR